MSQLAIGLMSGTSLDGVDAALVRFTGDRPDVELVGFLTLPYDAEDEARIRDVTTGGTARDCALLHVELGRLFAAAAAALLERTHTRARDVAFVASHGQTVWHEPRRASLQLGDPAVVAERIGVPVVSDFRSRDVAAGGQGAPLVPLADAVLFAADGRPRTLLNIGGIANVTWVPRDGDLDGVIAFDTGPGVAVVDAVVRSCDRDVRFDRDGARAARGTADRTVVQRLLQAPYFDRPPPKSTGRERFGDAYAADLARVVRASRTQASDDDIVATALALTVESIADQFRRWLPSDEIGQVVISGGGARNPTLVDALRDALPGCTVTLFSDLFFDGDAKEAVSFAFLGWLTMRGRVGNVPAATGAAGRRVLGRITPA